MDILMLYWSKHWSQTVSEFGHGQEKHSAGEWAAYRRSLKRRMPSLRVALRNALAGKKKKDK